MKSINWGRVVLGGIAAGVLINVSEYVLNEVVLKAQMQEAMKALGKSIPTGGTVIPVWILWSFMMGVAAVWLYAAIRPRYGAGPMTAVKAGVAVWVVAPLLSSIAFANLGIFALNGVMLVWTLVEAVVATVAGAWLYKEEGA
jgi:hypothetical protein